jgi:hypothetical protein
LPPKFAGALSEGLRHGKKNEAVTAVYPDVLLHLRRQSFDAFTFHLSLEILFPVFVLLSKWRQENPLLAITNKKNVGRKISQMPPREPVKGQQERGNRNGWRFRPGGPRVKHNSSTTNIVTLF